MSLLDKEVAREVDVEGVEVEVEGWFEDRVGLVAALPNPTMLD